MPELNWSPFVTNPIDFIAGAKYDGVRLEDYSGNSVVIRKPAQDFVVYLGPEMERVETGDNLSTCYFLNQRQVYAPKGLVKVEPDSTD